MFIKGGHGGGYGGHGGGGGTACIVKGSYCQCHYCKCEKGHVSCKGYGHEHGGYGETLWKWIQVILLIFQGKVTVTEVQKENTVTVIIVNVNMDSERRDTREVVDTNNDGECQW